MSHRIRKDKFKLAVCVATRDFPKKYGKDWEELTEQDSN